MEQRVTEEALLAGLGVEGRLGHVKATEIWAAAKLVLAKMPHLDDAGITAAVQTALGQPGLDDTVVMPIVERGRSLDPIDTSHSNGKAPAGEAPLGSHLRRLSEHRRERPLATLSRSVVRAPQPDPAVEAVRKHREHVANTTPSISRQRRRIALIVAAGIVGTATTALIVWLAQ